MTRHPGGEAHSRYLMELSFLPPGSRVLDMGAGDGGAVRLLRQLGYESAGVDLTPGPDVEQGDFLRLAWGPASFDGVLSQCSFYASGDVPGALAEASRVLRPGGKLVFSDVCYDPAALIGQLRAAGFAVRHMEDLTDQWRDYYLEALWRDEQVPAGKACSYLLMVCERM